jgi:hypothetical protein
MIKSNESMHCEHAKHEILAAEMKILGFGLQQNWNISMPKTPKPPTV